MVPLSIDPNKEICIFITLWCFGEIAQSVEQRTENPCVPSSILGFATTKKIFNASINRNDF